MAGRSRRAADRAASAALNKAVTAAASPLVARATRPLTRRVGRVLAGLVLFLVAAATVLGGGTAATVISVPLLAATIVDTNSDLDGFGPCVPSTVTGGDGAAIPGLSTHPATRVRQLENAATVIRVGADLGVPPRGWVVALATAMQESTLLNLPSLKVPESLKYPHDTYADGSVPAGDHLSIGLMQGQPWWWNNNVADGMVPAYQVRQFYGGPGKDTSNPGLLDIPGWEDMPITLAAQSVQRSAFPLAYAQHEDTATALVRNLNNIDPGTCDPNAPAGGEWVWPLNPLPEVSSPFGRRLHPVLGYWKLHDGTDWGAACGTPIYASGAGTARVEHPAWSGNLVVIDHGDGIETWYGHMSSVSVSTGDTVKAGQTIGAVGTEGYSTGCHLHFTVRVDGQPVDPVPWMREQIKNARPAPEPDTVPVVDAPSGNPVGGLTVLTYNVHYGRASAATREVAALAARHNPDVICLQEAAGVRRAPAGYRMHQPRVNDHGGKGPAASPLLIRTSIPITSRGHVELTGRKYVGKLGGKGAAYSTPRQIVWAVLDGQVTVGCTHFTAAKGANATRNQLWQTQAAKSVGFLNGGSPRLLAGDFNADPGSRDMSGFRRAATVDDNRAATHRGGGRIDMVWGSGAAPNGGRVLPRMGSDHMPVLTGWKLR